jgi:hypothetical protein
MAFTILVIQSDLDCSFSPPNVSVLRDVYDIDYDSKRSTLPSTTATAVMAATGTISPTSNNQPVPITSLTSPFDRTADKNEVIASNALEKNTKEQSNIKDMNSEIISKHGDQNIGADNKNDHIGTDQNEYQNNKESRSNQLVFVKREIQLNKKRISELSRTSKKPKINPAIKAEKMVNVYVQDTRKSLSLIVNYQTKGIDILQQATNNAGAYMLYVAKDTRDGPVVDANFPNLDAQTPIFNLGVNSFILLTKRTSLVSKGASGSTRTSQLVRDRGKGTLEDVILEVYMGNMSGTYIQHKPTLVPVAPDLLLKDLNKVLSNRFDIDEKKFTIYLMKDGNRKPLPKHYRDRTFRSLPGLVQIALIKIEEETPFSQAANNKQILTQSVPEEDNDNELVLPFDADALAYTEFRVIKTNKFGVRQERKLGIDSQKIYNLKPNSITSFLRLSSQNTKHPERPLEQLTAVNAAPDNPRTFTVDFSDGETLYYETKTTVEAQEIVKRLKYLLRLKKQEQNDSLLRRRSVSIMALNKAGSNAHGL